MSGPSADSLRRAPGRLAPRLGLRLLALASLALNLFLAAMLVSAEHHRAGYADLPLSERFVQRAVRDLPREDRQTLRSAFAERKAQFEQAQADYRTALDEVRALIATPGLDMPAVRAAVHLTRERRHRIGDLIEDTVIQTLPQLSPEGRARLAASGGP